MTDPPLVSVIIPVYNQAEYLADAVHSALAQSYPSLEVIIIDDASTDGSDRVIAGFSGDPRVAALRNAENLDCARTFNVGIREAKGTYYAILAADDSWEPGFLEALVAALEENPGAAFAYCRVNLMDPRGRKKPRRNDRIFYDRDFCGDQFEEIVRWINPIPHHATVVRKSCAEEAGLYDPELTTTHDWDLWLRLARKHPVAFVNRYLANYRVHQANVSMRRSREGDKERFIFSLLDRVFAREGLPGSLASEKCRIYARACLDVAEAYRVVRDYPAMRRLAGRALDYSRDPLLYLPYRRLLAALLNPLN
ncbi:MAG: glycosyltransferase [Candidatus Glassbacteria bacterium]|nr:glycosyltransferase [Candidatus Glassbacteria bacterium]